MESVAVVGRGGRTILTAMLIRLAFLVPLLVGITGSQSVVADTPVSVSASLPGTELRPGQQAAISIVLEIKSGYHIQSHKPLDPDLVPLEITFDQNPAITPGQVRYPPPVIEDDPAAGKISAYTGRTVVEAPFTISKTAGGKLTVSGRVQYQACDDKGQCLPPKNERFSVTINLPGTSAAVGTAAPPPAEKAAGADHSLVWWMGAAFLAGLIFNVMPCVLPVLPLKALSFYEVAKHSRSRSVVLSVVFSGGIIATFGVLSVLVLVLQTISWGAWFSKGWVVWTLVGILVLLAAGMLGAFSLRLPTAVYSVAPRHDTFTGNFLFGILTAVLSTPCVGPLFPPLLAIATQRPPLIGVALMLTVGIGMATPYVILSAFPELARRFPRTGPAAELVKQMMGFLLLGAAAFFAGARLFQSDRSWWLVFAVVVCGCIYLVARSIRLFPRPAPLAVVSALAVAMVGVSLWFIVTRTDATATPRTTASAEEVNWVPYSDGAFEAGRKQGRIVLVDFTARWCGNCKFIDATVFRDPRTIAALRGRDVLALKADLTVEGAPGQGKLKELSKTGGIPLTAIWFPGREKPVLLEAIYQTQALLDTFE